MEKLSVISSQTVISSDLEQLKAEFQAWRSQQTGRRIIPQYLWDKAFSLLKSYPLNVVRRELGLNRERLLAHLKSSQSPQPNSNLHSNVNCQPTFLQISPSELNISQSHAQSHAQNHAQNHAQKSKSSPEAKILPQVEETCRIVFEKSDGSRLSLQLSTNFSTIEALCNSFLKG